MLFHVTANHDHMTCPAREGGRDSAEAVQALKWIEGNDDVKVLGVMDIGTASRVFTLLEASEFDSLSALLRDQMLIGKAEVLPVNDAIARRKQGDLGKPRKASHRRPQTNSKCCGFVRC